MNGEVLGKEDGQIHGNQNEKQSRPVDESFVDDDRNIHQAVLNNRVSHDHGIQDDRKIPIGIKSTPKIGK